MREMIRSPFPINYLGFDFLYAVIWGLGHGGEIGIFSMFKGMSGVLSLMAVERG